MPVSKEQLDSFLGNYGLQDGETIDFEKYRKIITNGEKWHGKNFARFLANCFLSSGSPAPMGYENSASTFTFDYPEFDE
jgi:hypothetical protein